MILDRTTLSRALGEFAATALLMIVGCMGVAMTFPEETGFLVGSLQYGLTVGIVVHVFGCVSGAHTNPSVSISCCILGHIAFDMMLVYVACQLAGGLAGYYFLMAMLPKDVIDQSYPAVCLQEPMADLSDIQILAVEFTLTSVLVLGWCAQWDVRNGSCLDSAPIRMGLLVTACGFAGNQLTGASMNPAKTLVPLLFHDHQSTFYPQLGGQTLAAVLVPFIWRYALTSNAKPMKTTSRRPKRTRQY
ncbi:aquaporin-2 [Drosophila pseudoobscura]|uniref:Aquaporin-2 n=1 Tax=Drosophila pseudoobscura pseudoobscura TaxID=46245 RepID=A0A6I8V4E4_DROPS|nr:aquaporin-2 [Drosophila pseudoobscura]